MGLVNDFAEGRKVGAVAPPAVFELGGRTFVLRPADVEDAVAWMDAARDAVRKRMGDPISVLNAQLNRLSQEAQDGGEPLNPALLKVLGSAAFSAQTDEGGKGKAEPTEDQLLAWCFSLPGFRWYTLYRLTKAATNGPVTAAFVNEHVTDETWGRVSADFSRIDRVKAVHPERPTPA